MVIVVQGCLRKGHGVWTKLTGEGSIGKLEEGTKGETTIEKGPFERRADFGG
jgi:hypothetical protein